MKFAWIFLLVAFGASAQVYDSDDTPLRKSLEQPLSTARLASNRYKDLDRLIASYDDLKAILIFYVGGPTSSLNPQGAHTSAKDFAEYVYDNYGGPDRKILVRKIHQDPFPDKADDLSCYLIRNAKLKFPQLKTVLVGHSFGGASVIRIAQCLAKSQTTIDLGVTIDTFPRPQDLGKNLNEVPDNILLNYHFHQRHGLLQCAKDNFRKGGGTKDIYNYRQYTGSTPFYPHMYAFTNLVRYNVLPRLIDVVLGKTSSPARGGNPIPQAFLMERLQRSLNTYIEKYPLD